MLEQTRLTNNPVLRFPESLPKYLTVAEVAALLRLSKRTIYDWVSGRIPFIKLGDRTMFDRDKIYQWVERQADQPPPVKQPSVHALMDGAPLCGTKSPSARVSHDPSEVTCRRCLKKK